MPWGVAAAAVGAAGSIYSADKNANRTVQQSTQSPALTQATDTALTQGTALSQRPYTPYNATRVAPMSTNETIASGLAQTGGTEAKSYLTSAGQELSGIKDYTGTNLQSYMDPYVAATLTPQLKEANIQYQQENASLLNSKAGAFGGDRSALTAGQNTYNYMETTGRAIGDAYSKAYTNAQTAFFQDQNKKIQTANALATVGNDISKLNTQQIQDLMATGGLSRVLQQAQLDFDYNQFIEARDWGVNNMQPLLNSIAAAKGANMTTTVTGPASGIAGEAIGAAATIAGAYFTGGKSVTPDSNNPNNASYWSGGAMPTQGGFGGGGVTGYDPNAQPGMVYQG